MRKQIRIALMIVAGLLASCGGLRHVVYQPDLDCARHTLLRYTGRDDAGARWRLIGNTWCAESADGKASYCPDPIDRECHR